ncbi:Ig-like domain-containing protein [Pseudocnuella soli]|uniref:Ig-like domain-containing protein n=1 Tax=Pseudocnuella soli TaxID=2502779 RepID=UPI0010524D1A|nr:Ig-like domain-containing protein [Pseudocnuella soli]
MQKTFACLLLFVCSSIQVLQAQTQLPQIKSFQKPSGVSAPGESFAPAFGGSPSGDAPQVAEWTRTAGPDESVIMTGVSFSRHSGTDVGKDTRFTLYSASGVQGDAQIQRLDGDRAIVTIPRNIPSWGMYLMWPGNDAGYGNPIAINKTDAWWVGPDKATRGATISVYGRNLSRGGDTTTAYVYVRSKSSGAGQWASVKRVNPYKVDFVVPDGFANGEYEVWAHNGHGGDYGWGNPINLTIYDGVKWTGTTYNVKNYGAKGDGYSDDTKAIAAAIEASKFVTGATVYFPAGTYILTGTMEAHSNIRWQGEGRDRTTIRCGSNFTAQYGLVFGNPNHFEINDMAFEDNNNYRGGTGHPIHLVSSRHVTINNVRLTFRNHNVIDLNNTRYVSLNNVDLTGKYSFLGTASQLFIDRTSYKLTNDTDMGWHSWGGDGVSVTNSTARDLDNSNPFNGAGWGKGRFVAFLGSWGSSKNTYLGYNTSTDLVPRPYDVDQNSGEQILFEGYIGVWKGKPSSSTLNTTTVSGYSHNIPDRHYVVITGGRGLGQSRRIVANNGGVLTLNEPWNVAPDGSSILTIGNVVDRAAIYKNYLDGVSRVVTNKEHIAAAGVEPYGSTYNFIVDNNTFHQLRQGTANWAQQSQSEWPVGANYFSLYSNNKYINCRIAMQNIMDVKIPSGTAIFGTTYRKNVVQNAYEAAVVNIHGLFSSPLSDAAVYEHNNIQGSPIGFDSERTAGISNQVLYNNVFRGTGTSFAKEVTSKLALRGNSFEYFPSIYQITITTNDRSSTQTLGGVLEAPQRVVELNAPSGTDSVKGSFVLWNSGTAALSWTAQSNASWLRLGQTSGSIEGEKALSNIPLTAIARGLAQGRHRAELSVTTGGVVKKYTVWLNVAASTTVPNQAPTAQIMSPAAGSAFTAPASITIAANASDADGSVQRVEFYQGNVKIGEDLSAPYTFQWGNVAQGTYMLSVKAVDDKGVVGTSQSVQVSVSAAPVPNVAPTVSLTAPASGSRFTAPATINIAANANDADGSVSKVEFFANGNKIGEDASSPYQFSWSGVAAGSYTITAKAFDNDGSSATSAAATVTVDAQLVDKVNQAPTATVIGPLTGSAFTAPASVTITASATDADGTIAKVEFYQGSVKLGEDYTAPYSFAWTGIEAGTYQVSVRAIDDKGAVGTSRSEQISVAGTSASKPSATVVTLSSPEDGSKLTGPITVTLHATAESSNGSVTKVEFYMNGRKVGEDPTSLYSYSVGGLTEGTYSFVATAVHSDGTTTDSKTSTITVVAPVKKVPVVKITGPSEDAIIVAPANVNIGAEASDEDGTVSSVRFFLGTKQIAEDLTAPYTATLSNLEEGGYTVTAVATDNDGNQTTSNTLTFSVNADPSNSSQTGCAQTGGLYWEYFNNVPLTTSLSYHRAADAKPSGSRILTSFSAPRNFSDKFASRAMGYICPPVSGYYTFYFSSDDNGELWLSTDDNIENGRKIAFVNSWTNPGFYFKYPSQVSASIYLEKGRRYFVETVSMDYSFDDHMTVAWKMPNGTFQSPISGQHLIPYQPQTQLLSSTAAKAGTLEMTTNPKNVLAAGTMEVAPNPVQSTANIRFAVPESGKTVVELYNGNGALVTQLFNGVTEKQTTYQVSLNGTHLPNGVYYCRLVSGATILQKQVVIAH